MIPFRISNLIAPVLMLAMSACASAPPPATPTKKSPLEPPRVASDDAIRCRDLLDQLASNAKVAQADPTEDNIRRLLTYRHETADCETTGALTRREHAVLAQAILDAYAAWYARTPRNSAASLTGDPGALKSTSSTEPVSNLRGWTEHYLRLEQELEDLRGIDRSIGSSESPAERVPEIFMRVDALAGLLLNRLAGPSTEIDDDLTRSYLDRFATALRLEAQYWPKQKDGVARERKRFPGTHFELLIHDRFYRVSMLMRQLAEAWGERPIKLLRTHLGDPYRTYIASLAARHGTFTGPKFQWTATVPALDPNGTVGRTSQLPLSRIQEEVLYDGMNLRAMFLMRDAEERWSGLAQRSIVPWQPPSPRRTPQVEDALKRQHYREQLEAMYNDIDDAVQKTMLAARATEQKAARLAGLSRIVLASDIDDGRQTNPRSSGALDPVEVGLRRYASRTLGEVGLCLMNDTLFDLGENHSCQYPARPKPSEQCMAQPIVEEFREHKGRLRPIPEGTASAYERVLGAIAANWDISVLQRQAVLPPGGASASDAAACEIRFVASADTFGRLAFDPVTYNQVLGLIAAGRMTLRPDMAGPFFAASILTAQASAKARCTSAAAGNCTAQDLLEASGQGAFAQAQHDGYCEAVHTGAASYESLTQRGGAEILRSAGGRLKPLTDAEFHGIGRGLVSESRVCSAQAQGGAPLANSGGTRSRNPGLASRTP